MSQFYVDLLDLQCFKAVIVKLRKGSLTALLFPLVVASQGNTPSTHLVFVTLAHCCISWLPSTQPLSHSNNCTLGFLHNFIYFIIYWSYSYYIQCSLRHGFLTRLLASEGSQVFIICVFHYYSLLIRGCYFNKLYAVCM